MSEQTYLKVDPATLDAKKSSITNPLPTVPQAPLPPSMLFISGQAAAQIRASRDTLASALTSCQAEAHRLGACLECTANAYRTIDELKAAALNEGRPAGAESVLPPNPNLPPEVPFSAEAFPDAPDAEDALDWIAAAQQINAGDQGQSLHDFAGQMYRMADELTERGKDFSLGDTHWEGKAAESAEDRLRRHESWLYDAAGWAREIAGQAQKLAEAHRVAQQNHPDLQDVENFKKLPMVEQLG